MRLAITLGDVRGVGPEVVAKALRVVDPTRDEVLLVGPDDHPDPGYPYRAVDASCAEAGRAAGLAVEVATHLALEGEVDGIVTAPIHKPSLVEGGFRFPGHTEMLQELTGAEAVGMLMCHEPSGGSGEGTLRVLLATTHVALRRVADILTPALLVDQTRLLGRALMRDWGIPHPRIALCAFNPHASDSGLFGDEEERVYGPALADLQGDPWLTAGPLSADTVFIRALDGHFDAVVAPYHDVGMAPFKTVAFGQGVNVTLGLPFVRTSPDHGTAFDIAGKDAANADSMVCALRLALRLAAGRRTPVDAGV